MILRHYRSNKLRKWPAILCCCLWFVSAQAADAKALKAAVVFNIMMFVEWPNASQASTPLVLCADSGGELWTYLHTLEGRLVRNRPLNVRELPAPADVNACQAVVLEKEPSPPLAQRLRAGLPVLVFADAGIAGRDLDVVALDEVNGRMVFDVNLQAMRHNQLQLSSKLLRLARSLRNE